LDTISPVRAVPLRRLDQPWALAITVVVVVLVGVAEWTGPQHTSLVAGPLGAVLLLLLARLAGLSADDLGLGRGSLARGAAYAGGCICVVGVVYAVALALPATRLAFLDERYMVDPRSAVVTALVVIPLGTVLFQEVTFRGVLWGLVRSGHGPVTATLVSSVLFGLLHVVPSLQINRVNPAVAALVGLGGAGQVLAVVGAVCVTGLAGVLLCELRRRSGSLLPPIGLHWATNGLGALVSASVAR
jgi:membrane protease YdiL (CAAX protease family)